MRQDDAQAEAAVGQRVAPCDAAHGVGARAVGSGHGAFHKQGVGHDDDAVPNINDYTEEEIKEKAREMKALLDKYGFTVARVADGEDFGPVRPDSQRWIITAVKRYTQEEK